MNPASKKPEPIRLQVIRWQCQFCGLTRAKRDALASHLGRCFHNPETRSCKSCANYGSEWEGGCDCGHSLCQDRIARKVRFCAADDPNPPDLDEGLRTGCPLWQLPGTSNEESTKEGPCP